MIFSGPIVDFPKFDSVFDIFLQYYRNIDKNKITLIDVDSNKQLTSLDVQIYIRKFIIFLENHNIKEGDVITLISQNSWYFGIITLAIWYLGATIQLVNYEYTYDEIKHIVSITKPKLLICETYNKEKCKKLLLDFPNIEKLIDFNNENFEKIMNNITIDSNNIQWNPKKVDKSNSICVILSSSGTTGLPKAVPLVQKNLILMFNIVFITHFADEGIILCYLPQYHVYGFITSLTIIMKGLKLILLSKFEKNKFLQSIEKYKVTQLLIVPPTLHFFLNDPLVNDYDLTSLNDIFMGGSTVNNIIIEKANEKLKVIVRQGYGLTEITLAATVVLKDKLHLKKYESCGQIVPNIKMKICDDNDNALGINEIGEIRMKGDIITKGYLSISNEGVFDNDGYFKTGDLGYFDADHFLYITGRKKELIKYNCYQVSPTELESLLLKHPGVKDAAVIGLPDERAGELPLAFIVKESDVSLNEKEIIDFVKGNISRNKWLYGGVRFINEIPKSGTGKIERLKLKNILQSSL